MKKLYIIFLTFITLISYSTTLTDVSYKNGEFILKFDEKISIQSSNNLHNNLNNIKYNVLELILNDVKISNDVINNININDTFFKQFFVDDISDNKIGIFVYSQYGYKSSVSISKNTLKIKANNEKIPKRISPLTKKPLTIVLDPGHGGHDSGARGYGKLEKDIALEIVLKLAANLGRDHNVILTRNDDTFISLSERPSIGNINQADLFISIHLNSSSNSKANGAEIFYFSKESNPYTKKLVENEEKSDEISARNVSLVSQILGDFFINRTKEKSARLAEYVLNYYVENIGLRRRGVFGANFAVLRGSESASMLIELGFISNKDDLSILVSDSGQSKAVISIADAIREHFEE